MPYDANLDKNLFSKFWEKDTGMLTISVYSYNDGPKKLQITRSNKTTEGEVRFVKLGRLSKEEIEAILPLIDEALKQMD